MTTAAEHQYILDTRCDACGQKATHQATRAGGKRLQLCSHHEHISAAGLISQGFVVTTLTPTVVPA